MGAPGLTTHVKASSWCQRTGQYSRPKTLSVLPRLCTQILGTATGRSSSGHCHQTQPEQGCFSSSAAGPAILAGPGGQQTSPLGWSGGRRLRGPRQATDVSPGSLELKVLAEPRAAAWMKTQSLGEKDQRKASPWEGTIRNCLSLQSLTPHSSQARCSTAPPPSLASNLPLIPFLLYLSHRTSFCPLSSDMTPKKLLASSCECQVSPTQRPWSSDALSGPDGVLLDMLHILVPFWFLLTCRAHSKP